MNDTPSPVSETEAAAVVEPSLESPVDSDRPQHEDKLVQVAEDIKQDKSPVATPRELINWFGAKRRGTNVVASVRKALKKYNLITMPDFEFEYIDGLVHFGLANAVPTATTTTTTPSPESQDLADQIATDLPLNEGLVTTDPTYRIGKLAAANNKPLTVKPTDSIEKAVTLMMEYDYSQLPVVTTPSSVEGLFTWESFATHLHFHHLPQTVGECMVKAQVISSEVSIFDAITEIARHNLVLVRAPNKMITGIVTTFDLSHQFRQLGEPFLLLSEIENQIRRLLDGCFTLPELKAIRDKIDPDREVSSISDLTFGEYLRLIENPGNWNKLSLPLDRSEFVKKLDAVRVIRNSVMHFDPDGIAEDDLDTLRKFAGFLQRIADVNSENVG